MEAQGVMGAYKIIGRHELAEMGDKIDPRQVKIMKPFLFFSPRGEAEMGKLSHLTRLLPFICIALGYTAIPVLHAKSLQEQTVNEII